MTTYTLRNSTLIAVGDEWKFSFQINLFDGQSIQEVGTIFNNGNRYISFDISGDEIEPQSFVPANAALFERQLNENFVEAEVHKNGQLVGTIRTTYP